MDSITLNWFGPYSLNQMTPRELHRKMGVYAIVHGPSYIFIGKAKRGMGIFREAKVNREEEYWQGLKKLKLVTGEMPAHYKVIEEVYDYCELFAGVASKPELRLVDTLEKLLIFRFKPVCNDKYIKHLGDVEPLHVVNKGNPPLGLEITYTSLE